MSQESFEKKGRKGEEALNRWLSRQGMSYVAVCQASETFSPLFGTDLKRPDFLVLLDSIGLIAVDAKFHEPWNGTYSLGYEDEIQRVVTFERLFRLPFWYAYMSSEEGRLWYWVSALKALEVGKKKKRKKDGKEFLSIDLDHFLRIEDRFDFGKLYTQKMNSLRRLRNAPAD